MAADEIELDIVGDAVAVPRDVVSALAAAAAARAGISSRHRDLSILLGRALHSGKVSLSRSEARALRAVIEEDEGRFGPAGAALIRAAAA